MFVKMKVKFGDPIFGIPRLSARIKKKRNLNYVKIKGVNFGANP